LQQQNPPRFPFEQRTRAGLLLFMSTLRLYTKQALSISEQIELLKSRGLNIADSSKTAKFLGEVSYFRFVQYLRPMEADKTSHQFKPNSRFEDAVALYNFDMELRDLMFKAIQRLEIALRTKIIQEFSLEHGPFWFFDTSLADDEHKFIENMSSIDRELQRSKEDFIKEHRRNYLSSGKGPEEMIDPNTKTDYNKMKKLIQLDKLDGDRKGVIRTIAEKGEIVTTLYDTFPARMITDPQVFPSLLFYYGMLTIKATRGAKLILGIPNNNVRKQYDKYLSTDMLQPQE